MNNIEILISIIIALIFLLSLIFLFAPKTETQYAYHRGVRPSDLSGTQIKNNGWYVGDPSTGKCVIASPATAVPYVIFNNTTKTFTMNLTNISQSADPTTKCPTTPTTQPVATVGPSQSVYWETAGTSGQYSLPFVQGNITITDEANANIPICSGDDVTNCLPSYTIESSGLTSNQVLTVIIDNVKKYGPMAKAVVGALF